VVWQGHDRPICNGSNGCNEHGVRNTSVADITDLSYDRFVGVVWVLGFGLCRETAARLALGFGFWARPGGWVLGLGPAGGWVLGFHWTPENPSRGLNPLFDSVCIGQMGRDRHGATLAQRMQSNGLLHCPRVLHRSVHTWKTRRRTGSARPREEAPCGGWTGPKRMAPPGPKIATCRSTANERQSDPMRSAFASPPLACGIGLGADLAGNHRPRPTRDVLPHKKTRGVGFSCEGRSGSVNSAQVIKRSPFYSPFPDLLVSSLKFGI
jgi:hypothetical protein